MSKTLQFRRGTTSELSTIAGAVGELFVDTTKDTVVVMDGSTTGGFPLATEALLASIQSSLQSSINAKVDSSSLATVATSGSYNDLTDKPTIQTFNQSLNEFDPVSFGLVTLAGIISNGALSIQSGSNKSIILNPANGVVKIGPNNTVLTDANVKTINGNSIFGSGDITISGGSGGIALTDLSISVASAGSSNLTYDNTSGVFTFTPPDLSAKQDTLVSGSNIKSINGQSVLGSGNLVITGDGSVLDTSTFATKTDLLILDSDDIDEGLINQYYTNQKVANVLLNGTHTNISFAYNGSALSASVSLPATSGDTFDTLNIQQEEVVIGTVAGKSIIPATTAPVTYVGDLTGTTTSPIYATLNFNYAYFYSSYADIYTHRSGIDKIVELFAPGNIVRITKDGYWWDLQINGSNGSSSSYYNAQYSVIGTNSSWQYPSDYSSYYSWTQNISFASDLPVPQKYALTLNNAAIALGANDKLLFNGDPTDTPYSLNLTDRGTWDISITSGATDQVIFGSNSYYANQDPIKELLQVGNTITISDNNWLQNGTYLVTSVGADTVWGSTYGFSVQFQYVSGTNYNNTYTSLASLFNSFFASISGTIVPNYTTKYKSSNFSTLNNTSYVSFDNYDFINVGDEVSYIPGIASIQFKDDAGNNVKAISYNNLTGAIEYEGLVQAFDYSASKNNLWSINADINRKTDNITNSADNVIAIGNSSKSRSSSVAIGYNADASGSSAIAIGPQSSAQSIYATAVGPNSGASTFGTAIGYSSYSGSGVAIGTNASSNDGIALRGTAYGSNAINIGVFSGASQNSQITISSTNSSQYINQTSSVFFSDGNLNRNGATYLFAYNGGNSSQQSTISTSSTYTVDIANRFSKSSRMMLYGTATIMFKPTQESNVDDIKIIEIKLVIRSTASNTFALDIISTNNVFAGSGTLHPNWIPSFELNQNRYLNFKIDKGTDTTPLGVLCKVEFQVLHTA